jgi:hypothetical protein
MVRKRGLPDWAYYTIAVALTLPTLPVYWYFFTQRLHSADSFSHAVSQPARVPTRPTVSTPGSLIVYGEQLPPGYVCAAADGLAYRRRV